MADLLLGVDLGTSGLKLAAFHASADANSAGGDDGAVVAEAEVAYPLDSPQPGWAQIEVASWRAALDEALAAVAGSLDGARIVGLGLSGQMHGVVLVDEAGRALAPALLWPDQRAAAQVARWRALPGPDRAALANPLAPGMAGPLVAWLAEHDPALLARATTVLSPKDALRATLLPGADPAVTDRSDASATLLWDVAADGWSPAAVTAAGLEARQLPAVRPGSHAVASMPIGGRDVPVVVGGADTALALLAAGTTRGVQVNLGTGAQVLRPGTRPVPVLDPLVHAYAAADGGWYAMAALQNAGLAWGWVRQVLGLSWAELLASLDAGEPGAGGVSFRPFLTGERGGVAGPQDRGGWSGLHPGTTRSDLARSALEGVAFALAAALALLPGLPDDDDSAPVVLTGGGGRSPAVQQLLADVLDRPVQHLQVRSASAAGAAMLAAVGTGSSFTPQRTMGPLVEPRPDPRWADVHRRWAAG